MPESADLLTSLDNCPAGRTAWRQYEDICIDILKYLFVPPLQEPRIQIRNLSGIDRRDAIFANRNMDLQSVWGQLRTELSARLILFEFKNYDSQEISSDEVDQTRNYLTSTIGKLGIIISSKAPGESARRRRNQVYHHDGGKVILLLTSDHLREMVHMKERGDDPALLIMEQVELFYMEYD